MSKEKMWKGFDQLLVSPSVGPKISRRRLYRARTTKHDNMLHTRDQDDGWQIDDHSDDDTTDGGRDESDTLPSTITPSVPQSLIPAEVIERSRRGDQSDSEIEHISEVECLPHCDATSESSDPDDCLAVHCTKSRMTPLQFVDRNSIKRRRITDEMDISFVASSCRAKNRLLPDVTSPKRFKFISTCTRSTAGNSIMIGTAAEKSSRCWKSFDASFADLQDSFIEKLPSSPECANNDRSSFAEPLHIEELPSSADESIGRNRNSLPHSSTTPPAKSFYVTPQGTKRKSMKHLKSPPVTALATVLRDRRSQQHLWQYAIMSGAVQPDLVVRLDSIDQIFGRVMLRFFTATNEEEGDECAQEQIENIIFLDQGDKQLRSIQAGMEIALEVDKGIPPHRVSHNKLVHLGVTKLCPLPLSASNKR